MQSFSQNRKIVGWVVSVSVAEEWNKTQHFQYIKYQPISLQPPKNGSGDNCKQKKV
jgi:hypothetical protein